MCSFAKFLMVITTSLLPECRDAGLLTSRHLGISHPFVSSPTTTVLGDSPLIACGDTCTLDKLLEIRYGEHDPGAHLVIREAT